MNSNATVNNGSKSRFTKFFLTSGTSLILKAATFLCSFFLTRLIMKTYGSEVNGMVNSILQFLGIITLLEGGIGGIARAALYKPLAEKSKEKIEKIVTYLERFFRILSIIFIVYSLVIACIFNLFSNEFGFLYTFSLALIIAVSSFCEYFFGITYSILLSADQKAYVINFLTFFITIINFILCFVFIKKGLSIHIIKSITAIIYVIKPIFLSIYCRKKYKLQKIKLDKKDNPLPEKMSGLGVHIAYYLHRNTDTVLITIFLSLSMVSVYSVYNMIISGILTLIGSLSMGIEAAFGNMFAKQEFENLKEKFKKFVFYYQFFCTFLFSSTFILILPFVKIYTAGINDINYYQPLLAALFIAAEFFYCLRVPYNDLMVATNSFKKIRWGAYFEAIINIGVSIVLIYFWGVVGVVIGTLCAMLFRLVHYLFFFKKHVLNLSVGWFIKNTLISIFAFAINYGMSFLINVAPGETYYSWVLYALVVCSLNLFFMILVYSIMDRKMFSSMVAYFMRKFKRK